MAAVRDVNPRALLLQAASPVTVEQPEVLAGKRVLIVEDGPTTTHGGLPTGAGYRAAMQHGALPVDPRPWAVGSLAEVYQRYPHLGPVLPAMGYSETQRAELLATIEAASCDLVLVATPIDLRRLLAFSKPAVRVTYRVEVQGSPTLADVLARFRPA